MAAYLICHFGAEVCAGDSGRAELEQRVAELWDARLELGGGTWVVRAESTADAVRDALMPYLSEGDALLVLRGSEDAAWTGLGPSHSDWLIDNV